MHGTEGRTVSDANPLHGAARNGKPLRLHGAAPAGKERRLPGTSLSRVILPSDKSEGAVEVRKNYRKALVAKALASQNRRDLVDRYDDHRLRALE